MDRPDRTRVASRIQSPVSTRTHHSPSRTCSGYSGTNAASTSSPTSLITDDEPVQLGHLAEHIAAIENDKPIKALDSQERKRVYVAL